MNSFKNFFPVRFRALFAASFVVAILASCGQTGALYMPEPRSAPTTAIETQQPVTDTIPPQENPGQNGKPTTNGN